MNLTTLTKIFVLNNFGRIKYTQWERIIHYQVSVTLQYVLDAAST